MAGEDLDLVDDEGLVVDTVDLDDGHVVVVDGDLVRRTATEVDEAKAIPLAFLHASHRERNLRSTGISALSIDSRRILNTL